MRNNLNKLIKQLLVDQFENVVKEEIRQHNLAIAKNDNSLKELQETFREFYEEHKNLKSTNEALYYKTQKHFDDSNHAISESYKEQRAFIKKNDKKLHKTIDEFEQNYTNLVSHDLLFAFKNEIYEAFSTIYKELEGKKEDLKKDIYLSYIKNRSYINDHRLKTDERFHEANENIQSLLKELEIYKVDSKGVLREIEVAKREMFIMEKKIENIYTLIERLNKRIDACHKLD